MRDERGGVGLPAHPGHSLLHALRLGLGGKQFSNGSGDGPAVTLSKPSPVRIGDQLQRPRDRCGHDRRAAGQRLNPGVRQAFARRGQDKDIGGVEQDRQLTVSHRSQEADALGKAEFLRQGQSLHGLRPHVVSLVFLVVMALRGLVLQFGGAERSHPGMGEVRAAQQAFAENWQEAGGAPRLLHTVRGVGFVLRTQ